MNADFWKDTGERAVKTLAQTLLALFLASGTVFNIFAVDLKEALGVALGAAVISILTSLASLQAGNRGTASAVSTKTLESH